MKIEPTKKQMPPDLSRPGQSSDCHSDGPLIDSTDIEELYAGNPDVELASSWYEEHGISSAAAATVERLCTNQATLAAFRLGYEVRGLADNRRAERRGGASE